MRITISRWFTPDHNSVAPDGIQPDITAARGADTAHEDGPVLDALAYLADQPVADESEPSPEPSGSPSAWLTRRPSSACGPQAHLLGSRAA